MHRRHAILICLIVALLNHAAGTVCRSPSASDISRSSDYKRREGIHWNQAGHRRMATLVKQLYDWFASGRLDDELRHEFSRKELPPIGNPAVTATVSGRSPAADNVTIGQ